MRKYAQKKATVSEVLTLVEHILSERTLEELLEIKYTVKHTQTVIDLETGKPKEIEEDKEITLCNGYNMKWCFENLVSDFSFTHIKLYWEGIKLTPDDLALKFINIWDGFTSVYKESIYRMYLALSKEYDPVENYDRMEDTTTTDGRTTTHTDTRAVTHSGTDTNTETGNIDRNYQEGSQSTDNNSVTHYERSESSSAEIMVSKDVVSNGHTLTLNDKTTFNTHKNELSHGLVSTNSGTLTDANSGNVTVNSRVHGNVGVTQNQQMIMSELSLRKEQELCEVVVQMFADRELI